MTRKELNTYINREVKVFGRTCKGVYSSSNMHALSMLDAQYIGANSGTYGHNWTAYIVDIDDDNFIIALYNYYRNYNIDGHLGIDSNGYYYSGHDYVHHYICKDIIDIEKNADIFISKMSKKVDDIYHEFENIRDNSLDFLEINDMYKVYKKAAELYGVKYKSYKVLQLKIWHGEIKKHIRVK